MKLRFYPEVFDNQQSEFQNLFPARSRVLSKISRLPRPVHAGNTVQMDVAVAQWPRS